MEVNDQEPLTQDKLLARAEQALANSLEYNRNRYGLQVQRQAVSLNANQSKKLPLDCIAYAVEVDPDQTATDAAYVDNVKITGNSGGISQCSIMALDYVGDIELKAGASRINLMYVRVFLIKK